MDPMVAIKAWCEAWNTDDPDQVVQRYAADIHYEHPMVPAPLSGRQAVAEFIGGMGSAFSEIDVSVVHAVANGDEVAARVTHKARHTGDLPTPNGVVPATGKVVVFPAAHFMRLDADGLIVEEHMYANPLVMMAQLGLMPDPA